MLAAHERPSVLISALLTHHTGAAVAVGAGLTAGMFATLDSATSSETIGVGSAGALLLAMVALVFRTQQQQIRAQRFDMGRMARRIEQLEHELDEFRRRV